MSYGGNSRPPEGSFGEHLRANVKFEGGKSTLREGARSVKKMKPSAYDQRGVVTTTKDHYVALPRTHGATGYTAT